MSTNGLSSFLSDVWYFFCAIHRRVPIWPAILCWAVLGLGTTLGIVAMERNWWRMRFFQFDMALTGVILGQFGLATILGGLIARSWVTSWFFAVMLVCFQTLVASFVLDGAITGERALSRLAICGLWPALMLSTCAPLIVLRSIFGWTLSRQPEEAIPRWSSSMEDLLLVGVVIGCTMTISQVFLVTEAPQNLAQVILIMGFFAAISLVCVPPVVYISFRAKNWIRRIAGWIALSLLTFGVIFIEAVVMERYFNSGYQALPDMMVGVPSGCITVAIGMACILASGYKLTYFERKSSQSATEIKVTETKAPETKAPETDAPETDGLKEPTAVSSAPFKADWLDDSLEEKVERHFDFGPRWQARAITALLVCVAVAGAGGVYLARQRQLHFYEELASKDLREVLVADNDVTGIHFGPDFTNADLKKYLKYAPTVTTLSFAGTKVTDAIVPELSAFRRLESLDFSDTAITDEALERLRARSSLTRLSLANTKVTWAAIVKFANRHRVNSLDLAGLGITDEQLKDGIRVSELGLARNPITDKGVESLLEKSELFRLDLTDTAITGATLKTLACPQSVIFDGTKINDANLVAILSLGKVRRLSLARTKITAAILPQLNGRSVRLGEGPITERDLITTTPISLTYLGLNDKQFTGQCLVGGNIQTSYLDLSGSSLTDEIAGSLNAGGWRQYLSLANTQVTDKCLGVLMASEVDLRGTKVTADGISKRNSYFRIFISHNQFTPEEMIILKRSQVEVNCRPMSDQAP